MLSISVSRSRSVTVPVLVSAPLLLSLSSLELTRVPWRTAAVTERAFREGMPSAQENTTPMEKAVSSGGGHLRRKSRRTRNPGRRNVGKWRPLGIDLSNSHPREKPVAGEEPPYHICTTRYNHEEKIKIKVRIRGIDGTEQATTDLVDSGASDNFIDKAYAEAIAIPMQQKTTPQRVLTVDGSEVAGRPVTHHA